MLYILSAPFVILLLSVALCPLLCPDFWSKHFSKIVAVLSIFVVSGYMICHDYVSPILAVVEYLQFVLLIVSLYVVSGGICIEVKRKGTPLLNTVMLLCGACCANIIGTTGSAALFIRPFMNINKNRLSAYHVVFFIFTVSNVGGSLLPIGDPPLFLGFLKGVPFFWTLQHNVLPWFVAVSILLLVFYVIDAYHYNRSRHIDISSGNSIAIHGKRNFIWLAGIIGAVFINPVIFPVIPVIHLHGHDIPFIRELLLCIFTICAYVSSDKSALQKNEFSLEPIHELVILFIGIFITMMPANELIKQVIHRIDPSYITTNVLFWGTAILSSFLDNAPTYLNMLTISMSSKGLNVNDYNDVLDYANGIYIGSVQHLRAISLASVFFGAMTYIGNGPNLMVKAIAEKNGVIMPSFFGYMLRYSFSILFPVLVIIWFIFC